MGIAKTWFIYTLSSLALASLLSFVAGFVGGLSQGLIYGNSKLVMLAVQFALALLASFISFRWAVRKFLRASDLVTPQSAP